MWYARVRAKAAKGRRIDASRNHCGKLPKAKTSGLRYCWADDVRGQAVTWGRYRRIDNARGLGGDVRVDNCTANEGKNTLWRNKDFLTDKEATGREEVLKSVSSSMLLSCLVLLCPVSCPVFSLSILPAYLLRLPSIRPPGLVDPAGLPPPVTFNPTTSVFGSPRRVVLVGLVNGPTCSFGPQCVVFKLVALKMLSARGVVEISV
ncbi:hypothetical protein BY996DRAFT_6413930 [Phakopsora pachyrhizi]|nr:hypothetical protein BY996DRAFT_6413930 [Phakopsora pachyrhizi]